MSKRKHRKQDKGKIVVIEGNLSEMSAEGKRPRSVAIQQKEDRLFKQQNERPLSFPLLSGEFPQN